MEREKLSTNFAAVLGRKESNRLEITHGKRKGRGRKGMSYRLPDRNRFTNSSVALVRETSGRRKKPRISQRNCNVRMNH